MTSCSAFGCTNRASKRLPGVSFHNFPIDEFRRLQWIRAVRRKDWLPSKQSKLCSTHFTEDMIDRSMRNIVLKPFAVPTIFTFSPHLQTLMANCVVLGCANKVNKHPPGISFHNFPTDEPRRANWIKALRQRDKNFLPLKCSKLCSAHFTEEVLDRSSKRIQLLPSAVPMLFGIPLPLKKVHPRKPDFVKQVRVHDIRTGQTRTFDLNVLSLKKNEYLASLPKSVVDLNTAELAIGHQNTKNKEIKETEFKQKEKDVDKQKMTKQETVTDTASKDNEILNSEIIPNDKEIKSASPSSGTWSQDEISALIALFELETCLYHTKDPDFTSTTKKTIALKRIQQVMAFIRSSFTIDQVKNKVQYLKFKYAEEKFRKLESIRNGFCTEDTYEPKLWYFKLLYFLDDHVEPRRERIAERCENKNENSEVHNMEENKQHETLTENLEDIFHSNEKEKSKELHSEKNKQHERLVIDLEEEYENNEQQTSKELHREENDQHERLAKELEKELENEQEPIQELHSIEDEPHDRLAESCESDLEDKQEEMKESEDEQNGKLAENLQSDLENEDDVNQESNEEKLINSADESEREDKKSEDDLNQDSDEEQFENAANDSEVENNKSEGDSTNKRKESFLCPPSKKIHLQDDISASCLMDREIIFGRYVANEMKIIKNNPFLYIKTKQAILNVLASANIQALNSGS